MATKAVPVKCPRCGRDLTERSGGLDAGRNFTCHHCGHQFKLEEFAKTALREEGREILEQAAKRLSKTIKRINRKFR